MPSQDLINHGYFVIINGVVTVFAVLILADIIADYIPGMKASYEV